MQAVWGALYEDCGAKDKGAEISLKLAPPAMICSVTVQKAYLSSQSLTSTVQRRDRHDAVIESVSMYGWTHPVRGNMCF